MSANAAIPEGFATIGTSQVAWREFVLRHPQACIFHHPAWSEVLQRQYGFETLAACWYRGGEIVAGLPYCIVDSPFRAKRWVSLPFSDYCSPLAPGPAEEELLLEHLLRSAQQANARLEIRAPSSGVAGLGETTTHWLHTTDISLTEEALLKRFHADTRRSIRKARESGLATEFRQDTDALAEFYRLHTLTRRRLGVPVQPWNYFVSFSRHVLQQGLGFVALTSSGSKPIAAGVFCSFNGRTCYKYGASADERGLANYTMLWDAMRKARELGSTSFDFGKTSMDNAGLRFFKQKWGSCETPLAYSSSPPERPAVKSERAIVARMAGAFIRNSPTVVCRLAGEALYKHFAA